MTINKGNQMNLIMDILQWTVVAVLIPVFIWVLIQVTKVALQLSLILIKILMELTIEVIKLAFSILINLLSSGIRKLA